MKAARLQRHLSPAEACNEVPRGAGEAHCPDTHALTHTHVHDKWPRAAKPLHANACFVCVFGRVPLFAYAEQRVSRHLAALSSLPSLLCLVSEPLGY